MQLKKIVLACAVALALPMAAHAVAPANGYDTGLTNIPGTPASTTGPAMLVQLSGATAPDNFLVTILSGLLKPGFYQYTAGNGYRLFLGETLGTLPVGAPAGYPLNQKILFVKRSKGGSVFGVNPVGETTAALQRLETMILTPARCPTQATAGGPAVACNIDPAIPANVRAIVGVDPGLGTPTGEEDIPDFGVSDVAPFMFKEPFNVEFGQLQLANTNNLTIRGVNTLMMGIVTTAAVPDTLNITKADYNAMLVPGAISNWTQLGLVVPASDLKTNVVVCRRVPGSGTQTTYNWYFNQFPCTANSVTSGVSGNTAPSRMTDSDGYNTSLIAGSDGSGIGTANRILVDVTAGYTVVENSGSGDVRTCMRAANNRLQYDFQDEAGLFHRVNFNANRGTGDTANSGYRAIGVLSLDSQTNTSTTAANGGSESAWFFRALNGNGRFYQNGQTCLVGATLSGPNAAPVGGTPATGVCPNRATLRTGDYDFAAELTMQFQTSPTNPRASLISQRNGFIDAFITRAGDPANQVLWTLSLPNPPSIVPTGTNAVAQASRQGNQCGPMIRSFPLAPI